MTSYVAFLRGINVGGIRIRMPDLAAVFTGLGLADVRTVLASGNVLFSARGTRAALKASIERALTKTFGYEAWVVLLRPPELQAIVDAYPFDEGDAAMQPYVVLGLDRKAFDELVGLRRRLAAGEERIHPGDGVLYWEVRRGSSTDSLFAKEAAKARYKAASTTRNMRTLRRILDLAAG